MFYFLKLFLRHIRVSLFLVRVPGSCQLTEVSQTDPITDGYFAKRNLRFRPRQATASLVSAQVTFRVLARRHIRGPSGSQLVGRGLREDRHLCTYTRVWLRMLDSMRYGCSQRLDCVGGISPSWWSCSLFLVSPVLSPKSTITIHALAESPCRPNSKFTIPS